MKQLICVGLLALAVILGGCRTTENTVSMNIDIYRTMVEDYKGIRPMLIFAEQDELRYSEVQRKALKNLREAIEMQHKLIEIQIEDGRINREAMDNLMRMMIAIMPVVL